MNFKKSFYLVEAWNMYFGEEYPCTLKEYDNGKILEYSVEDKKNSKTDVYKFDLTEFFRDYKSKETTEKELAETLTWQYFSDTLPSIYELCEEDINVHVLWTLIWIAMQSKKS